MNTTTQLNLHPDAESLNAFAEQALAATEREQVLAHLAGCSRCRQVVFLAQQAAAEAEVPARVPATRPTAQPKKWLWNWRFAWVPAAALAAALALVVTFHPRHTEPAPEMAKVEPPSQAVVPARVPQEPAGAGASHKPAQALETNPAAGHAKFGARRGPSQELPAPSAAPPAEPATFGASSGASNAFLPSSVESAPQTAIATQYQPEPAVAAWPREQQRTAGTLSAGADAAQVSQKSLRMEAYSAHASRQAATSGPRMAQQSQSAPSANFDIATQQQLAGSSASHKEKLPKLPSGLEAVSRATAQHLMLEIDRAGTLFLSDETGEHWEPVARQWTGRAIEVRAKSVLSGSPATAEIFELKNDAGSTWASADGKTWTAQ
ncbi:MAG TPA: zf-HC2 domain-containing protein [Terracidiphilus sp.]|nr:zf-HC2 domain-containing protein [Terracidiphilus sp.]